jgi:glutamine amidotransferase
VIAVVDYGLGNLGSVMRAFRRLGVPAVLSDDPAVLLAARGLVLPGDGAFAATMAEIRDRRLPPVLAEAVARGLPLLGICVGMQVLFEEGEEGGAHRGLGLLGGVVRRLRVAPLPVPHMGWNALRLRRPHPLVAGTPDGAHVYFVHSYHCEAREEDVVATAEHGVEVVAVAARGNVLGVQFHPEKSQAVGLALVARFAGLCASAVREEAS